MSVTKFNSFALALATNYGVDIKLTRSFRLAGGDVNKAYGIELSNGVDIFMKANEKDNVDFYIKEFQLAKWFDTNKIVYSDGTFAGKPAPDIFQIAANKIGIHPKDCIVFEDALSGIESAKNAGIGKIIAVTSMENENYYKNIDGVFDIIPNFKNILEFIKIEIPIK